MALSRTLRWVTFRNNADTQARTFLCQKMAATFSISLLGCRQYTPKRGKSQPVKESSSDIFRYNFWQPRQFAQAFLQPLFDPLYRLLPDPNQLPSRQT